MSYIAKVPIASAHGTFRPGEAVDAPEPVLSAWEAAGIIEPGEAPASAEVAPFRRGQEAARHRRRVTATTGPAEQATEG